MGTIYGNINTHKNKNSGNVMLFYGRLWEPTTYSMSNKGRSKPVMFYSYVTTAARRTNLQGFTKSTFREDNHMKITPIPEECLVGGIETFSDLTEYTDLEISNLSKKKQEMHK